MTLMLENSIQKNFYGLPPVENGIEVLDIISSSENLNWQGVGVQRTHTLSFDVENLASPFHFFLLLTSDLSMFEIKRNGVFQNITLSTGQVHVSPANFSISGRTHTEYESVRVGLDQSRLVDPVSGEPLSSDVSFEGRFAATDPQLRALIEALIFEAEAGGPNGSLFVDSLATALSVHYVSNYAVKSLTPAKKNGAISKKLSTQQMELVKEYMDAHLSSNLTLDDISHELGMSKFYFSRMFKHTVGSSPYQFYLARRLEKARLFLDQGRFSLTEIAHLLNFSDQSHFSRVFKKRFGLSPRAYLKN